MAISADGRFVAYEFIPDEDREQRIYIWDRKRGGRRWINRETGGHPPFTGEVAGISADGDKVTFVTGSYTGETPQVWVMDQTTGVVTQVSVSSNEEAANGYSAGGDMSPDGRYVLFESFADNLMGVGGDKNFIQDVFLRDLETGTTAIVSLREDGMQSLQGWHWAGGVSDDGCKAAFESDSSDVVANDTNSETDVFVRDVCAGTTARVSVGPDGTGGDAPSSRGMLSGDGSWAAFQSRASNLAPEDRDGKWDVFVRGPLG
jgi:Tol biopolymer transport system component